MKRTETTEEYLNLVSELKEKIDKNGYKQEDKRMERMTQALPGHFIIISNPKLLEWLQGGKVLDKYKADSKRMYSSFRVAMKNAKEDVNSRRLMVFNDLKFKQVNECFTHFQFVYTHRNEFDLYVYQRSSDLDKLRDDLIFFAHQMKKFERGTGYYVTKLAVVYGSIHYEIK